MNRIQLSDNEISNIKVGEPFTLTAVMAVLAVAIVTVIVYKLFTSGKGKTSLPGGWTFQWN